jgi:hypothetical protein
MTRGVTGESRTLNKRRNWRKQQKQRRNMRKQDSELEEEHEEAALRTH